MPPENLEAVAKVALDPYQREVVKTLTVSAAAGDRLDLSDYGQGGKVIVDVITLDSEGCAPCQYMVEAVKSVMPQFEGIVEWREHKIKHKEALTWMSALMVKNIPTICIDGQIAFVSRIPARDELIHAVQKRIFEKLKMKIHRRRATLYILGDGGDGCRTIQANVERAIRELGAQIDISLVTDPQWIQAYGLVPAQLPAVVLARYQIKAVKSVPEVAIVKEWVKDLL